MYKDPSIPASPVFCFALFSVYLSLTFAFHEHVEEVCPSTRKLSERRAGSVEMIVGHAQVLWVPEHHQLLKTINILEYITQKALIQMHTYFLDRENI